MTPVLHPADGEPVARPTPPAAPRPPVRHGPPHDAVPLDDVLPAGWVLLCDVPDRIGTGPPHPGDADALHRITFADVDHDGLQRWIAPATAALVRPDRVVFGTANAADVPGLLEAAGRWTAVDLPRPAVHDRPPSTIDPGR